MKNIVYQVTWKHMKMNKRRTCTMFLGIFFMVLLMTCVIAGKRTAVDYLQKTGAQKKGSWHVCMYDVSQKEYEAVRKLSYVEKTARSADLGYMEFAGSANDERPYLYVKAYEESCFSWMNVKLKEGRLPQNEKEIVISERAVDDGAKTRLGDSINGTYFERYITGISEGVTTTFPFQDLTVTYGETQKLPQEFPLYNENDSFRIEKKVMGKETELTVVGIVEVPWFEQGDSAGYPAFTCYDETRQDSFNLSMIMDLSAAGFDMYEDLEKIAGDRKLEFNNYVLSFSGDSSDSTVNAIVGIMSAFFMIAIMLAAVILIYNVFHISFEERSRYLGMLCSVGATGRQKRSSVYFEAFSLFLAAWPLGILAGCLVVWIGMSLFQPFIYSIMNIPSGLLEKVPIRLEISFGDVLLILAVSALTVFLSALLPAKKISKIGPVECIRGNLDKENRHRAKRRTSLGKLGAERLLARNSLYYQKRKTKGIKRAAAVFMIILIVTVSGAQMLTRLVTYRMVDRETVSMNNQGWDYQLSVTEGDRQKYEAIRREIKEDPGVEAVGEKYSGMFIGNIPNEVLSGEYWTDVHKVFNLYYHRELTQQEFQEHFSSGQSPLNMVAVEKEVFEEIAKKTDTDLSLLTSSGIPCAILVQSGEVSTENWGVGGMTPEKFQFYEVENMTDLQKGDTLPVTLYSPEKGKGEEFPICIAGFANNKQLEDYVQFHSEWLWMIVDLETAEKMSAVATDSDNQDEGYRMLDRTLYLRLNGQESELLQHLTALSEDDGSGFLLAPAQYVKTIAGAVNSIIEILLAGFVLLTSVICLLNLYNSVHGWISEQKRHFAMMVSIGMTRKQIEKMLFYEAIHLIAGSSIRAVLISTPVLLGLRECLAERFGYVKFAFPWWIYTAAICTTAIVILAFMRYHYRREKSNQLRAVFMG